MEALAVLTTALLFGGMTLYSFGFAAFVLSALPAETARPLIRQAFPHFYLFVIAGALVAAVVLAFADPLSAALMAGIAATTVWARQGLMPAINAATDAGDMARFGRLHGVSVALTLIHIALAAWVLVRLV